MGAHYPAQGYDARVQLGHSVGDLRVRHDHQRTGIAAESAIVGVGDHADNLPRGLFKLRPHRMPDHDLLADRIFLGEELLGQRFVDEGDTRRSGRVLIGEFAAAQDGDSEQLVVVGRGAHPSRLPADPWTDRPAVHDGERETELTLDGEAAGKGRFFDAGNGVEPLSAVVRELGHSGRLFEARAGQRHLHGDDVVGVEAGIDGVQGDEGADQQRGTNEQDDGQRDFADDQWGTDVPVADAGAGAVAAVLERGVQIGARHAERRKQSEQDSGEPGKQ